MSGQALACSGCGRPLGGGPAELRAMQRCPQCSVALRVAVFPAYRRRSDGGGAGQPVVVDGESVCCFHDTRRAAAACERCGRLVCSLCDMDLDGQHVCPECLPELDRQGCVEVLERHRIRHDSIVWLLLFLGLLFFILLGPVCGLVALAWGFWHWRSPPSRVARTRLRLALAMPVALAEIVFGVWLWLEMFGGGR